MLNLAVIFGGLSPEHDISVITALQSMARLNPLKYDIFPVYIKNKTLYTGKLQNIQAFTPFCPKKCIKITLAEGSFYTYSKGIAIKKYTPDCALICCHGGEGENGALQGMLDINDIPYTSSGVLASAVGMDKAVQKELFASMMLNVVEHVTIGAEELKRDKTKILTHILTYLNFPLIVKPARLGSSIGIGRVSSDKELLEALAVAAEFDNKIVVERGLTDFIELNCAAYKNGANLVISEVERPVSARDILTFEDKYLSGGKGMEGAGREFPAKISAELTEIIKSALKTVYTELGLSGVVRADFMYDQKIDKLYINEINTIPGSMAGYLFMPEDCGFTDMLDCIISEAIYNREKIRRCQRHYGTGVLKNYQKNSSGIKH